MEVSLAFACDIGGHIASIGSFIIFFTALPYQNYTYLRSGPISKGSCCLRYRISWWLNSNWGFLLSASMDFRKFTRITGSECFLLIIFHWSNQILLLEGFLIFCGWLRIFSFSFFHPLAVEWINLVRFYHCTAITREFVGPFAASLKESVGDSLPSTMDFEWLGGGAVVIVSTIYSCEMCSTTRSLTRNDSVFDSDHLQVVRLFQLLRSG